MILSVFLCTSSHCLCLQCNNLLQNSSNGEVSMLGPSLKYWILKAMHSHKGILSLDYDTVLYIVFFTQCITHFCRLFALGGSKYCFDQVMLQNTKKGTLISFFDIFLYPLSNVWQVFTYLWNTFLGFHIYNIPKTPIILDFSSFVILCKP